MPLTSFPYGLQAFPTIGADLWAFFQGPKDTGAFPAPVQPGNTFFVDGDYGNNSLDGLTPNTAVKTLTKAVALAKANAVIYVKAKNIGALGIASVAYAETFIITNAQPGLKIVGVGGGVSVGNQPLLKIGAGAVAMITVRAPSCTFVNLAFDGTGSTGAGILLDDDGGTTKSAFGTVIQNCSFKSFPNKTSSAGAICIAATGGGQQSSIKGCHFIDCCTSINSLGVTSLVLRDIVIEDCLFYASANTVVDADIELNAAASLNIMVRNCEFGCVDVPAKAGGATARYIDLTGWTGGGLLNCRFSCTGKTFGAAGNAILVPATLRIAGCFQEVAAGAGATGEIGRT